MPAVSVCDPVSVALRHSLDTAGQSKSSDDLNIGLAGSASRILRTDLDYEETDNYRSTVQDHLKSKYIVLSLPKQENSDNGKVKDGPSCSRSLEKSKEPRLPEPAITLYPAEKVNLGWTKNFPIGAGMYNVGNTCYLNSTLQALFHVPAFVNWLLSDSHHDTKCELNVRDRFFLDGAGECLTCAIAKTLQSSHQKSGDAIKPFSVYNKLKLICRTMVPGHQEDAHEFLRYLLEGMEKAYLARHKTIKLDSYSKETTPINQIFGGYIRTEVKCLQCRHVSTTFQHFQDLLLDIRKAGTLDEALAGYFSREQLDNNDYKCEACKRRVPATKQFILERPPKVLCIQLKRFSVIGGKISRQIKFKQTVDMGPYIRRPPGEPPSKVLYRLASMVTHCGLSANCGHYTAIAQVSSGEFYSFDDSSVCQISLNNVVVTNAYIMIFEMEPGSSANCQAHSSSQMVSVKSDGSMSKTTSLSFPHSNGLSSKLLDSNGSKSMSSPSKGGENSSPSKPKDREVGAGPTTPPPPPPPSPPLIQTNHVRRSFIGPQLPPYMKKNRLYESSKSGKIVDYDGDSSDNEENNGFVSFSKLSRDDREFHKSPNHVTSSSKSNKTNGNGYSYSPQISRSPLSHNGNGHSLSNGADLNGADNSSVNSNSSCSRGSSPKNILSNGKSEHNGSLNNKSKDKWYSKSQIDSEQKVYTKASANVNNKGWIVCKDTPSPSSTAAANGWSVSDNLSDDSNSSSRSNSYSLTPSAADMRNFDGNNRSDTISHLQKSTHWGYGNSNVNSWNGNKTRIDREVDNQRRQDRKRSYDNDEDEYDRGRTKKVKSHHNNDYKSRGDSKYNPFQEHQKWKQLSHYRPNNNYQYSRSRHGGSGNYNVPPHQQRYQNKLRTHWIPRN